VTRIIYLHGFASSPGSYKAQYFIKALRARGLDPLLPDLNQGEDGFRGLTVSRMLADVERLSEGCGPGELILMGSSMGGYVAARFAAMSDRPRALVLMCPAFGFMRRWAERMTPEELERWREEGEMEVMHFATNKMTPLGWTMMADALEHPEVPDVAVPTLLFHGRQDEVVDPAGSEAYAATHPNVELTLLDADHGMGEVIEPIIERSMAWLEPLL
jgi:uncharacterized protein